MKAIYYRDLMNDVPIQRWLLWRRALLLPNTLWRRLWRTPQPYGFVDSSTRYVTREFSADVGSLY